MKLKNNLKNQSTSANKAQNTWHIFVACSITVNSLLTACANQSPSEAWIHTSRNGLWSREEIAKPLLENAKIEGKARADILLLLGAPDLSEQNVTRDKDDAARNDTYQLSFLNTTSLDIEYDSKDVVKRYSFGPGCLANYFPGPGHESGGTNYSIRKQLNADLMQVKEGELEKLWGPPDLAEVDIVPTFPTPLRSSYYSWRLTPDGRVYNLAETSGMFNILPAGRQIVTLVTVTLGPDCPVRRPVEPGIK